MHRMRTGTHTGWILFLFVLACGIVSAGFYWAMGDGNPLRPILDSLFPDSSASGTESEEGTESVLSFPEPEKLVIAPVESAPPRWEQWMFFLVNEKYPLEEPMEQILMEYHEILVDSRVYQPLVNMVQAAEEEGYTLVCTAGYRSWEDQDLLYEQEVETWMERGYNQREAELEAQKEVERGGCSEHQTGLAVDIGDGSMSVVSPEFQWLQQHAWEYGFILRYPQGKEEKTGKPFSSFHYRYVGRETAEIIQEKGLCLEEYAESMQGKEDAG